MPNERLRSSISASHLAIEDFAARVGVDPKTVERWITKDRVPHRNHRFAAAAVLGEDEAYLWPQVTDDTRTRAATEAEFVSLYPHRGAVPADLWRTLIETAGEAIDVLVYAGLFLPDGYPDIAKLLRARAERGTRVRLLLGDADSAAVRLRGYEEGIGDALGARVRLSLTYLKDVIGSPGVELRLHGTTLYNSIFRFDDDMLVNTHVYGAPAAHSPVLHFRRLLGGRLFQHYQAAFERVWTEANPERTQDAAVLTPARSG